jgi:superfamily II DNA or RNA helicase
MSDFFIPREHQSKACRVLIDNPQCALFSLPGTGKTTIALSVIKILKLKPMIVAPLQVALTSWPEEIERWAQFSALDYGIAHGKSREGAFTHDVTIINPEGLRWLDDRQHLLASKDSLFVDESTPFKTWGSKRTKYIKRILGYFKRRHIMTGTPVPRNVLDWFSQQYIVDEGKSFGTEITKFRKKYFYPTGYENRDWAPFEKTPERMAHMAEGRFHVAENGDIKMPGVHIIDIDISLNGDARKVYDGMAKKMVSVVKKRFKKGAKLTSKEANDETDKYGKLRQIASGALYDDTIASRGNSRRYTVIHTLKFDRVVSIINEIGERVVVLNNFVFEAAELRKRLKGLSVGELNGSTPIKDRASIKKKWNDGKLDVLIIHPKSGAHGLNLQHGGHHMIWMSLTDSAELYEQANARMNRMDANERVIIYRLIVKNSVEKNVIVRRLDERISTQKALIDYCKELDKRYDA